MSGARRRRRPRRRVSRASSAATTANSTCTPTSPASARRTGKHVGLALKQHQRRWALGRGIMTIEWTFDPLVRRNAYFNLVKLGARVVGYEPAFYGAMHDAFNDGDDTDRAVVRWNLEEKDRGPTEEIEGAVILDAGDDGRPVTPPAPGPGAGATPGLDSFRHRRAQASGLGPCSSLAEGSAGHLRRRGARRLCRNSYDQRRLVHAQPGRTLSHGARL